MRYWYLLWDMICSVWTVLLMKIFFLFCLLMYDYLLWDMVAQFWRVNVVMQ